MKQTHNKERNLLRFVNLFSLLLFAALLAGIADPGVISQTDLWVSRTIVQVWTPALNSTVQGITLVASPASLFTLSFIALGVLACRKKWREALLFLLSIGGGLLLTGMVKLAVQRLRPEISLVSTFGYSFPSGHAALSLIFLFALLAVFRNLLRNQAQQKVLIVIATILAIMIGLSRIYLNAHWLSDVIAGFALAFFWLTTLQLHFPLKKTRA